MKSFHEEALCAALLAVCLTGTSGCRDAYAGPPQGYERVVLAQGELPERFVEGVRRTEAELSDRQARVTLAGDWGLESALRGMIGGSEPVGGGRGGTGGTPGEPTRDLV